MCHLFQVYVDNGCSLLPDDPSLAFSSAGGSDLNQGRNANAMRISIRRVYDVHRQSRASYEPLTPAQQWKLRSQPNDLQQSDFNLDGNDSALTYAHTAWHVGESG